MFYERFEFKEYVSRIISLSYLILKLKYPVIVTTAIILVIYPASLINIYFTLASPDELYYYIIKYSITILPLGLMFITLVIFYEYRCTPVTDIIRIYNKTMAFEVIATVILYIAAVSVVLIVSFWMIDKKKYTLINTIGVILLFEGIMYLSYALIQNIVFSVFSTLLFHFMGLVYMDENVSAFSVLSAYDCNKYTLSKTIFTMVSFAIIFMTGVIVEKKNRK